MTYTQNLENMGVTCGALAGRVPFWNRVEPLPPGSDCQRTGIIQQIMLLHLGYLIV